MTNQKTEPNKEVNVTTNSGGAGWFVALLLLAVILVGGYMFRDTIFGDGTKDVNISIEVPDITKE